MALAAVALPRFKATLSLSFSAVFGSGKERVRLVRQLSDRIGETANGIEEIHTNNSARRELADSQAVWGLSMMSAFRFISEVYHKVFKQLD